MNLNKQNWTKKAYKEYIDFLLSLKDEKYLAFQSKIVGNTKYKMIGIRVPILRTIAKDIKKGNVREFLKFIGSTYYEEIMIEGLIISALEDLTLIPKFLPKIDNWAICDIFFSKFKKVLNNPDEYFDVFLSFLKSNEEFTVRYGLVCLLAHYANRKYANRIFNEIEKITAQQYYVNMAVSWLICEIYINAKDETIEYLKVSKLNNWIINKSISKIRESNRPTKEEKDYLNTFKRK